MKLPILRSWRHRTCRCGHPRSIHTGDIPGWRTCNALRCGCANFAWERLDKPLLRSTEETS